MEAHVHFDIDRPLFAALQRIVLQKTTLGFAVHKHVEAF